MFTGIVEQMGSVKEVTEHQSTRRLLIEGEGLSDMSVGGSISVSGVCLTATSVDGSVIAVEVVPETLSRTTLGDIEPGDRINLERPMAADGLFDGHLVQGHVDGLGTVTAVETEEGGTVLSVRAPESLQPYLVEKGSIAIDGVSLTVTGVEGPVFTVALIPTTLEVTTIGLRKSGDGVNLEVDIIAKYVEKMLKARS